MHRGILYFGVAIAGILGYLLLRENPSATGVNGDDAKKAQIERGKYLVTIAGCNDCHTTKIPNPNDPKGFEFDSTLLLSGFPADYKLPEVPAGVIGPEQWGAIMTHDLTAFAGPWGTSFARNLTPDTATGLGSWTEEIFIKAMRTGKDMGEGRAILPPMPWFNFALMTDDDLKAIFAYLRTLKPIENPVPDPIAPTGERLPTLKKPKN